MTPQARRKKKKKKKKKKKNITEPRRGDACSLFSNSIPRINNSFPRNNSFPSFDNHSKDLLCSLTGQND